MLSSVAVKDAKHAPRTSKLRTVLAERQIYPIVISIPISAKVTTERNDPNKQITHHQCAKQQFGGRVISRLPVEGY